MAHSAGAAEPAGDERGVARPPACLHPPDPRAIPQFKDVVNGRVSGKRGVCVFMTFVFGRTHVMELCNVLVTAVFNNGLAQVWDTESLVLAST